MKLTFLKSVVVAIMALSLWSCQKEESKVVATAGTGAILKSSATTVVLDKNMLTTPVITFSLDNANFGYQAAISNVLQVAKKGTNFVDAKETILPANANIKVFNGLDFNSLLLSLNLPTTVNSDVEIRVKSSISNTVAPVYSNVISLSAKPFPLTAWIYVPGNYQGWNPATADSLVSLTGNGVYTGVIAFDGGNFKITPQKKWDVAYGNAGAGKISTTGGDINSISAGPKELVVDLNLNTYTITPLVWSMIGNAVPGSNWTIDIDLKAINDAQGTWTITTPMTIGTFKFRKNHDWGTSIGTSSGGDINITSAGTYKLTLTVNADGKTGSYTAVKL